MAKKNEAASNAAATQKAGLKTGTKAADVKPGAEEAKAKADAKAAEKPAKPAKEPKPEKPKVEKDAKNGITRPKPDTICGKVWAIADKLTKGDKPAKRADVLVKTGEEGIDPSTAATQYGRWRRYNGIKGRIDAE